MPVTYEEKNKDLPGYMQVYQMESNRKLENGIISTITPTNDVSLRTFMIRYTPENTFRFKPSGLFRSPSAFVLAFFTALIILMLVACIKTKNYYQMLGALSIYGFFFHKLGRPLFFKSFRFQALIDASGITINQDHYNWSQLAGTFIVKHVGHKYYEAFLVLAPTDGVPLYFPLAAYSQNAPKFATAITRFNPPIISANEVLPS